MTDRELEALFESHKGVDLSDSPFERVRSEGLRATTGAGPTAAYALIFGLVGLWVVWALFFAGKGKGAFSGMPKTHAINARSQIEVGKNLLAESDRMEDCGQAMQLRHMAHEALGRAERDSRYVEDMGLRRSVASFRRKLRRSRIKACKL